VLTTAARLLGDVDDASRHLANARERAARLRLPAEEAYLAAEAVRLAGQAGDAEASAARRDEARSLARDTGLGLLAARL